MFASYRSITDLDMIHRGDEQYSQTPFINDAAMLALGSLRHLRSLRISTSRCELIMSSDLSSLLPPDCWPNMRLISLDGFDLSITQLVTLMSAAPQCERFTHHTMHSSITALETLAVVLHHSACMTHVDITLSRNGTHSVPLKRVFQRYPICDKVQNLVSVTLISEEDMCVGTYHYLLSQFTQAPKLIHFRVLQQHDLLSSCSLRILPQLCADSLVPWLMNQPNRDFIMKFDQLHQFVCDAIDADSGGTGVHHYRFRYSHSPDPSIIRSNDSSTTRRGDASRQAYFDTLYASLNNRQQMILARWEAGDYSSECCPNSLVNHFLNRLQTISSGFFAQQ